MSEKTIKFPIVSFLLFIGVFLLLPTSVSAQSYIGADRTEFITAVNFISGTSYEIVSDSFGDCVGSGYGSSRIEIYFWNGSSWTLYGQSISGCTTDQYHGYGWGSFNTSDYGDGNYAIMYGQGFGSWPASAQQYQAFTVSGGAVVPPVTNTQTRIETVTPPNDIDGSSARATSTTFAFEATGYVNENNFVEGMRLIVRARNNVAAASNAVGPLFSEGGNALCSWMPDWLCPPLPGEDETYTFSGPGSYEFEFPITSAGDFSVSTTTDVQIIGRYTMFTTLEQPNSSFFGLSTSYSAFVSTTTQFTVATSSSYDRAIGATVEAIQLSQTAVDPECSFDFFTPSNYLPAIQTCITSLFAVPTAYVADGLMGAMSDLLSHAPWGYATRVYVILTQETASSTLPSLAVDVPDGLPMGGTALPDFAPWSGIEVAVAQLDVADVETMEGSPLENFEFWWNFMWSLMFAFWVIRELYGMAEMGDFEDLAERAGFAGGRAHGRIRKASNGQKYQEYTTADTKRLIRRGSRKGVIH